MEAIESNSEPQTCHIPQEPIFLAGLHNSFYEVWGPQFPDATGIIE